MSPFFARITFGLAFVLALVVAFASAQEKKKPASGDDKPAPGKKAPADDDKPAPEKKAPPGDDDKPAPEDKDKAPEDKKRDKAEADYRQRVLDKAEQEYRQRFKKPETPAEFWAALKFEIEVGQFDLAAEFLKGFAAAVKDNDKELLNIEEAEGLSAFLRLRTVPTWVNDPTVDKAIRTKANKEARAAVEEIIGHVTRVLTALLEDKERITKFIHNLTGTPEEQGYALLQLRRSGAVAVPYMIDVLRSTQDAAEHDEILRAFLKLNQNIVPPLLAALDIADPPLRVALIDVLQRRGETAAVPSLWYLSAAREVSPEVRRKAKEALVYFEKVAPEKLTPAKVAITREAERYERHGVKFRDPAAVTVWQSDGKGVNVPAAKMTATQAEEYYGLKFARQALDLDPTYLPAQLLLLSLALEKSAERAGLDKPAEKEVAELLKTVNPDLVTTALDRALAERKPAVILGAVKALGDLGEVRAARTTARGNPALVRALDYPDRRVQMAAADALLRLPRTDVRPPAGKIVEVLRRALNADAAPRVLVGIANADYADRVAQALRQAGFEAVIAPTGRAALTRLADASDIDAILIEDTLPDPGLPYLLAQLRADLHVGLLPVLLLAPPERELRLGRQIERYRNIWQMPPTLKPAELKQTLLAHITEATGQPLAEAERKDFTNKAMTWLRKLAVGEVPGYDVRLAEDAILRALRSDELAASAVEAAGKLPGRAPQRELARLVLEENRKPELRAVAAGELVRHIQKNGLVLTSDVIDGLQKLFSKTDDAKLRPELALVIGGLRPDAVQTGERLKNYTPPTKGATPPAEAPKENER